MFRMDEFFKIPGLNWDNLTVRQSRQKQNFVSQELSRYKTKIGYLARLINQKLVPVPIEKFNPHDPCDAVKMLKSEWNNKDINQQNGHYTIMTNKNYSQDGFATFMTNILS